MVASIWFLNLRVVDLGFSLPFLNSIYPEFPNDLFLFVVYI